MNYTVDWPPHVLADLTDIWLAAPDRAAVTAAQARADRLLQSDPHRNGRHLAEGLYRTVVAPLILTYTIDDVGRIVVVQSVRHN